MTESPGHQQNTPSLHPGIQSPGGQRPWAVYGLGLLICGLWMLTHPYLGITHDGMLYALFALARLYPGSLGHDFFVLNGTQDHFTAFGPLYSIAIRIFGLDHATALGVFITQAAFLYSSWSIARRFTSPDQALLSIALLILLPSLYGDRLVFSHTEMFLTPRQPAEALVLLGIGSLLDGRHWTAGAFMAASALLHPIIAAAGIAFWVILDAGLPRPRRMLAILAIGIASCGVLASIPNSPIQRFDDEWLSALQERQPFLFPTRWDMTAWCWSIPCLTALLTGAWLSTNHTIRRICLATVITAGTGLVLSIVGGDFLHLTLATQLQTWRWLWLPGVLSALLLPGIVLDSWNSGALGRAAAVLLTAGWLDPRHLPKLACLFLAILCGACTGRHVAPPVRNAVLSSAFAVAAISLFQLASDTASLIHHLATEHVGQAHLAARIAQFQILSKDAFLSIIIVLAVWVAGKTLDFRGSLLITLLGAIFCAIMIPYSISAWTKEQYPPGDTARFESWRQIIPGNSEVLWPDAPPVTAWYSLHRPSYWSMLQMYGIVFSRRDFEIGTRRERASLTLLGRLGGFPGDQTVSLPAAAADTTLTNLCELPDLSYVVSWRELGPTPYPTLTATHPGTGKSDTLWLYRCAHGGP